MVGGTNGLDAVEEVVEAHGAVGVHRALHARVLVAQLHAVAAAAALAVEKLVGAAHAADAALVAVKLALLLVVEEDARAAEVLAHRHATRHALLGDGLLGVAQQAHHVRHVRPRQLVVVLLVVAVPAGHQLAEKKH